MIDHKLQHNFLKVLDMELKNARSLGKKVKEIHFTRIGNNWEAKTWYV